jgi:hypothetical protein
VVLLIHNAIDACLDSACRTSMMRLQPPESVSRLARQSSRVGARDSLDSAKSSVQRR